jgi:hypothetical protein
MRDKLCRLNLGAALLASTLCFDCAVPAIAGGFVTDASPVAQSTDTTVIIKGVAGDSFSISFTDSKGVARSVTVTVTVSNFNQRWTVPAGKGTKITIKNLSEPKVPSQSVNSLAFAPGLQRAETVLAINAGSTFTAFGQTFDLGGSFQTVATSYDLDPSSPTYGNLSGFIPSSAFEVLATNGPQQIHFSLNSDTLFSITAALTPGTALPDTGIAVPYDQPLSGTLTFLGLTEPFTGDINGAVTFFADNLETIAGHIVLNDIGSGQFSSSGQTVVVPEPRTWLLLALGLPLALALRRFGNRRWRERDRSRARCRPSSWMALP